MATKPHDRKYTDTRAPVAIRCKQHVHWSIPDNSSAEIVHSGTSGEREMVNVLLGKTDHFDELIPPVTLLSRKCSLTSFPTYAKPEKGRISSPPSCNLPGQLESRLIHTVVTSSMPTNSHVFMVFMSFSLTGIRRARG